MKFDVQRDDILGPLNVVLGIVEKKQTQPILSNILINVKNGLITLTASDLQMEIIATANVDSVKDGDITVPVRKFVDTCKTLDEGAKLTFSLNKEKAVITSNKTRFSLTTLPANDFPVINKDNPLLEFKIPEKSLKRLFDKVSFAMAFQDVRYYLNGLLLEINRDKLKTVATDGHRLAISEAQFESGINEPKSVIIPRKAVLEISRLLGDSEEMVTVTFGQNYIRLHFQNVIFTSKLVEGQYPNYDSVIPKSCDIKISVNKNEIKQCLIRTSILSNEKYRGIKLEFSKNTLKTFANNPDQEEAKDEIPIDFDGGKLEVGFNVNYLIDAISALDSDTVDINITDSNGSSLIKANDDDSCIYVVMPMRL